MPIMNPITFLKNLFKKHKFNVGDKIKFKKSKRHTVFTVINVYTPADFYKEDLLYCLSYNGGGLLDWYVSDVDSMMEYYTEPNDILKRML